MIASTPSHPISVPVRAPRRSLARIFALETRCELLKLLRLPGYTLPTIGFPLVFYIFFGVSLGSKMAGSVRMAAYLIATYGAFGVIGVALFGFGVATAVERGQGWMLLKRATPMPPFAWIAAKLATCVAFSAVQVGLLFVLGATLGGVRLPAASWAALAGTLIAGSIPFGAFGLALGYLCGPNSAVAVMNLIHLPSAFLAGLWIPVAMLPRIFQQIAVFLPQYHFSQLALHIVVGGAGGAGGSSPGTSVAVLAGFTMASVLLAGFAIRRDEGKTFG
jgi:ABC-2 type transport system permease protein